MPIFAPFFGQLFKNFNILPRFNSETTWLIFSMTLPDIEELEQLLMHASTKRYYILFWNARSESEVGQFSTSAEKASKLIGYYSIATSLELPRNLC